MKFAHLTIKEAAIRSFMCCEFHSSIVDVAQLSPVLIANYCSVESPGSLEEMGGWAVVGRTCELSLNFISVQTNDPLALTC